MKYGTLFAAVSIACFATGCTDRTDVSDAPLTAVEAATTDADYDAFIATANEAFVVLDAREADLTGLVAALPSYASLTWDSKSFDAASGATVFSGLAIGFGEDQHFGLSFEEARIWGLEPDLLAARLAGERLSESGAIFTRLDGTNASYFGISQTLNAWIGGMLTQVDGDFPDDFEISLDTFESNIERVVATGVSLRPWEFVPLSAETVAEFDEEIPEDVLSLIHIAQQLVAITRSISIDESVSFGSQTKLEFRQTGAATTADYSVDFAGARNVRGFDIDLNLARGVSGGQVNEFGGDLDPEDVMALPGLPAGFTLAQSESYDEARITDMRLDKVMGYLARSELPGMDERDLLSLGRWAFSGYRTRLNDREYLTADQAYFNGDNFEWVIPSDLSFGITGATLNTGELTGFFQILFETFLNEAALEDIDESDRTQMEQVREGVEKAIELLPQHGLDTLPFDAAFSLKWDADTGPTDFAMAFDADGYGQSTFDLGLTLPNYDQVKVAYESEDRESLFEQAFEQVFAFRGAQFVEVDKGGYDKLFGFAHDLGKEYPNEGWGAMLGSMEPEQLRSYLGTIMRMGKPSAAAEFPPAEAWLESYAVYLESGGRIEFISNPPEAITMELIERYDDADPEPEQIVEILGLTVTHTK
ncbi:MAG: hypothetical protein AAFY82_08695 [Pseudomonadota bacterium]